MQENIKENFIDYSESSGKGCCSFEIIYNGERLKFYQFPEPPKDITFSYLLSGKKGSVFCRDVNSYDECIKKCLEYYNNNLLRDYDSKYWYEYFKNKLDNLNN